MTISIIYYLPVKHVVSNVLHNGDSEAKRSPANGPVHLLAVAEHLLPGPGWEEDLAVAGSQVGIERG